MKRFIQINNEALERAIRDCTPLQLRVLMALATVATGYPVTLKNYGKDIRLNKGDVPPARVANLWKDLGMPRTTLIHIFHRLKRKNCINYHTERIGKSRFVSFITGYLIIGSSIRTEVGTGIPKEKQGKVGTGTGTVAGNTYNKRYEEDNEEYSSYLEYDRVSPLATHPSTASSGDPFNLESPL
jgi:hypothetical protein